MRFCYRIVSPIITLFIPLTFSFAQVPPKREFRGAWIATVLNLDWPSAARKNPFEGQAQRDELRSLMDQLAATGINAVIFQIRTECDALYNSPYEPWSYWLTGEQGRAPFDGYDPLEFAVQEAHKRGMEIHAWFNPYRAERVAGSYPLAANHVAILHPDWVIQVGNYRFLNPGLRSVRDYTASVIADVVRRYDIDGAHMDDYFYQEGITTQDAATFQAEPREFTNIGDWRRDNVNLLIKQVYDSIKAIKPNVKWGISPRGIWKNGVPPGIFGADNYSVIYCDAVAWLQGQYIDYIAPQLYWQFGGGQDYALLQPWWASQLNGRHLYTGNATYRIAQNRWPASEIVNQIKFNRSQQNAHGTIQFRARNVTNDDGGIASLLRADVFRSPAVIPVMEWKEQTPPNAPTNLRWKMLAGSDQFWLEWDAPAPASDGDTAVRYVAYRFLTSSPVPSDLEVGTNLIAVTGQTESIPPARIDTVGVQYSYAISALDRNNNESILSKILSISTPIETPVLAYPADGEQYFPKGGSLKWLKNPTALRYKLQVSRASDFSPTSLVGTFETSDTAVTVSGLAAQSTYYWRVVAGNQGGVGSYTGPRSFTTGWPLPPMLLTPPIANNVSRTPTFSWTRSGGTSFRLLVTDNTLPPPGTVLDVTLSDTFYVVSQPLAPYKIYLWKVLASNAYGSSEWSTEGRFRTESATVAEREGTLPTEFRLSQNYPNPFNSTTTIRFSMAERRMASLRVYDVLGREVRVLLDGVADVGTYTVTLDAHDLPSGVYFYRLVAGEFIEVKKLQLVR